MIINCPSRSSMQKSAVHQQRCDHLPSIIVCPLKNCLLLLRDIQPQFPFLYFSQNKHFEMEQWWVLILSLRRQSYVEHAVLVSSKRDSCTYLKFVRSIKVREFFRIQLLSVVSKNSVRKNVSVNTKQIENQSILQFFFTIKKQITDISLDIQSRHCLSVMSTPARCHRNNSLVSTFKATKLMAMVRIS